MFNLPRPMKFLDLTCLKGFSHTCQECYMNHVTVHGQASGQANWMPLIACIRICKVSHNQPVLRWTSSRIYKSIIVWYVLACGLISRDKASMLSGTYDGLPYLILHEIRERPVAVTTKHWNGQGMLTHWRLGGSFIILDHLQTWKWNEVEISRVPTYLPR